MADLFDRVLRQYEHNYYRFGRRSFTHNDVYISSKNVSLRYTRFIYGTIILKTKCIHIGSHLSDRRRFNNRKTARRRCVAKIGFPVLRNKAFYGGVRGKEHIFHPSVYRSVGPAKNRDSS